MSLHDETQFISEIMDVLFEYYDFDDILPYFVDTPPMNTYHSSSGLTGLPPVGSMFDYNFQPTELAESTQVETLNEELSKIMEEFANADDFYNFPDIPMPTLPAKWDPSCFKNTYWGKKLTPGMGLHGPNMFHE